LKEENLTNRSIFLLKLLCKKDNEMLIIVWIQSKDFKFSIIIGHYLLSCNYFETSVALNSLFLFNVFFVWGFNVVKLFIIFKSKKLNCEKNSFKYLWRNDVQMNPNLLKVSQNHVKCHLFLILLIWILLFHHTYKNKMDDTNGYKYMVVKTITFLNHWHFFIH